jgi:hypothetical protein
LTYTTVDDKIPTKYRLLLPSRLGQSTSLLMVYVLSLSVVAMDFAIPYHMKHKTGEKKVTNNHTCGGCNTKTSVPHS